MCFILHSNTCAGAYVRCVILFLFFLYVNQFQSLFCPSFLVIFDCNFFCSFNTVFFANVHAPALVRVCRSCLVLWDWSSPVEPPVFIGGVKHGLRKVRVVSRAICSSLVYFSMNRAKYSTLAQQTCIF